MSTRRRFHRRPFSWISTLSGSQLENDGITIGDSSLLMAASSDRVNRGGSLRILNSRKGVMIGIRLVYFTRRATSFDHCILDTVCLCWKKWGIELFIRYMRTYHSSLNLNPRGKLALSLAKPHTQVVIPKYYLRANRHRKMNFQLVIDIDLIVSDFVSSFKIIYLVWK